MILKCAIIRNIDNLSGVVSACGLTPLSTSSTSCAAGLASFEGRFRYGLTKNERLRSRLGSPLTKSRGIPNRGWTQCIWPEGLWGDGSALSCFSPRRCSQIAISTPPFLLSSVASTSAPLNYPMIERGLTSHSPLPCFLNSNPVPFASGWRRIVHLLAFYWIQVDWQQLEAFWHRREFKLQLCQVQPCSWIGK